MYYHGVINGLVDKKILSILNKKEVASATRMGLNKTNGFNEGDYISLCKNLGWHVYQKYPDNNAFNKYIFNNFCFIIDEDIEAKEAVFIPNAKNMKAMDLYFLKRNNPDKRFSDLVDEYQAYGYIPISKVVGVGIPYNKEVVDGFIILSKFCALTPSEFQELIRQVEKQANELGIKIVDSSDYEALTQFENNKQYH